MTIDIFFDYTCGFSNRARHWLDALTALQIRWRPFSLLQQNHRDEAVFEQAEYADNVSLIALAVHEQVRADGGDVDGYRRRMFTAWHEESGRLTTEDIVGFGRDAGLRRFDREAGFTAVAAEHAEGEKLGVFGTPTLGLADGQVIFVKLDAVPGTERARPLWEAVHDLSVGGPELREWQRVTASGAPSRGTGRSPS
jgi:predicted DsbA family dithiol-disulfide isomerase